MTIGKVVIKKKSDFFTTRLIKKNYGKRRSGGRTLRLNGKKTIKTPRLQLLNILIVSW